MKYLIKDKKTRRGAALILTLLIVGLLAASTLTYIKTTHLEARTADNVYSYTQASVLTRAGLEGAKTILAMDDMKYDAKTDMWARFDQAASLAGGFFDEGSFTGKIVDLSSRLNPNYLVDSKGFYDPDRLAQFERLFMNLQLDPGLLTPVLDWLDINEETRNGGAESPYYYSLESPYPAGNGPLETPGRIMMVKGITADVYYGTKDNRGLGEFITVHSDGRININTADELVLISLDDDLTQDTAKEIIRQRNAEPFEKVDDLKLITGMTPELFSRIAGFCSVKSQYFLIRIEGRFREAAAVCTAVVERSEKGITMVYYQGL